MALYLFFTVLYFLYMRGADVFTTCAVVFSPSNTIRKYLAHPQPYPRPYLRKILSFTSLRIRVLPCILPLTGYKHRDTKRARTPPAQALPNQLRYTHTSNKISALATRQR